MWRIVIICLFTARVILAPCTASSQEGPPALPEGLGEGAGAETSSDDPALPSGLDDETKPGSPDGPALPSGLTEDKPSTKSEETAAEAEKDRRLLPPGLGGFWELRGGARLRDDPAQDDASLAETRLQVSYDGTATDLLPRGRFRITGDFLFDSLEDDRTSVDLDSGEGFFDLRELWFSFTPLEFMDVKAGRQVLTWGTGNLVFLNDLFPKDYRSFFLGRRLEYLKAPSDAVKVSLYSDFANLDAVYTPRFDPNRFVSGNRLSYFDAGFGGVRGEADPINPDLPDDSFKDDEIALRLYRTIGGYELAVYGYEGFWKNPAGTDATTRRRIFPPLSAVGASIRGTVGPGIGNLEIARYESDDDEDGDDPFIPNDQVRFLAGFEMEAATDLTVGLQYYLERILDYDEYESTLPPEFPARDENRQWLTLELTREMLSQNQLVLNLFLFYSISGGDAHIRPKATYDFTDHWQFQVGSNIFLGDRETFFGRFEENTNVYGSVRYSF